MVLLVIHTCGSPGIHTNGTPRIYAGGSSSIHTGGSRGIQTGVSLGIHAGGSSGFHACGSPGIHVGDCSCIPTNGSSCIHTGGFPGVHTGGSPGIHAGVSSIESSNVKVSRRDRYPDHKCDLGLGPGRKGLVPDAKLRTRLTSMIVSSQISLESCRFRSQGRLGPTDRARCLW